MASRRARFEGAAGAVQRKPQAAAKYCENFPRRLPANDGRIRTALTAHDAVALAEGAHALKGSIGNFGAIGGAGNHTGDGKNRAAG